MKCFPHQVIKIALGKLCLMAAAAVRAIFFLFFLLLLPLPAHLANLGELKYANIWQPFYKGRLLNILGAFELC